MQYVTHLFYRYMFFVHPLKYHRYLNKYTLACLIIFLYAASVSHTLYHTFAIKQFYSSTTLRILSESSGIIKIILTFAFVIPTLGITIFAAVSILWLVVKKRQVDPHYGVGGGTREVDDTRKKAKAALKLILAVCGAFWGTFMPASLINAYLFGNVYSASDLDRTRMSVSTRIGIRLIVFLYVNVSSALNPIIFYYTHPEMRNRLAQMKVRIRNAILPAA